MVLIHLTKIFTLFFVAFLDELRSVEMQTLNMKLAARGNTDPSCRDGFFYDMVFSLVAERVKKSATCRRVPVVSFESVTGIAAIDQIPKCIAPSERYWMEMIYCQERPDFCFVSATVTTAKVVAWTNLFSKIHQATRSSSESL